MSALVGMLIAFGLVIGAIALGGSAGAFFDVRGLMIVFFGTFAVTAVSFGPGQILHVPRLVWDVLRTGQRDLSAETIRLLKLATEARKHQDLLSLQKLVGKLRDRPFLAKAVTMAAEGHSPDEIEQNMRQDANSIAERHGEAVDILRRMGDIAPAMGLIGTLVGLVQMLGSLDQPEGIGPAMQVALLTTLYGALLAHLIFIPLAAKTEQCANEENLLNNIYAMGAASIRRQENPRRLEMLLNTVLPPTARVRHFK